MTEAVGLFWSSAKRDFFGMARCTRLCWISSRLLIVRVSSPWRARCRLSCWTNSVTPRFFVSKISNPTPPPFGRPEAASSSRSCDTCSPGTEIVSPPGESW
ncbi:MAG: hypothetical protein A4E67_01446 [Syntrophaceae bacterium PtaB.Bin038]|nr:MAG: hypothetical protein A4E67_01446 [Syntrophaceae bacterium PtaB.Bin038]